FPYTTLFRSHSLKSGSSFISIREEFSSLQVKVGDVCVSVLQSCSSSGFSSTFWISNKYSDGKSSNSSSLISSFTDMSICDGSVDPAIVDLSSVFQRKSSHILIQCKTFA